MKRFLLIILGVGLILSCKIQTNKPSITDEVFEPTDEELFAACAELKGVAQFHIGESTIKDVLKDGDFKKNANSLTSLTRDSNFYNGHWGFEFWSKWNDDFSTRRKTADWIVETSKGSIKQLLPDFFESFKIGDIEFKDFNMAFLNDTLVAIFFYPEDKFESDVIGHYKEKYGDGRGHNKWFYSNVHVGKNVTATENLDEKRTWANENIALDFVREKYFHMAPGRASDYHSKHSMMVYSKKRYPVFESLLREYAAEYEETTKEKKTQDLNSL